MQSSPFQSGLFPGSAGRACRKDIFDLFKRMKWFLNPRPPSAAFITLSLILVFKYFEWDILQISSSSE